MSQSRPATTGAQIPGLTGLRAVAALAVCVTHAAFWSGDFTPDVAGAAYARLEAAVPVFFALSGFLLSRPWLDGAVDVRRYARHRAWRVLPAYWVVVTAVYLLYQWHPDPSTSGHGVGGYLRNMLFVQVYGVGHVHSGLTQTWSMAVEVVFYLLLPVIGIALGRSTNRAWLTVAAMTLLTVGWVTLVTATEVFGKTARTWPPSYGAAFAAGIAVALLAHRLRRSRRLKWTLLAAAGGAYLVLLTPLAGPIDLSLPTPAQGVLKYLLHALIGGLLVAAMLCGPSRFVGSRAVVWLGSISYEFFLIHVVVMELVVVELLGYSLFRGSTWPTAALTTALTLPMAALLHTAIERLRLRVAGRARGPRPPTPLSPR